MRMPSRYTSQTSLDDAADCAEMLGLNCETISIEPVVGVFDTMMVNAFAGRAVDATEENIQARVRGIILMALSNKLGHMVLTTGNKSEMSVGYATLYGDMCGGYAPLGDLYKTQAEEQGYASSRYTMGARCSGKRAGVTKWQVYEGCAVQHWRSQVLRRRTAWSGGEGWN